MKWHKRVFALIATLIVSLGVDQFLKAYFLRRGESFTQDSFVHFGVYWNAGIAFSIELPRFLLIMLILVAFFFVLWIFFFELKKYSTSVGVAAGLVLGGALGNVIDRLRFGAVLDYIYVAERSIFNIADVFVVGGLAWLLILFVLERRVEEK